MVLALICNINIGASGGRHRCEVSCKAQALLQQFVLKQYPVLTLQQTNVNVKPLYKQSWQRSVRHRCVQSRAQGACTVQLAQGQTWRALTSNVLDGHQVLE